jgi:hypothetical protein
MRGVGTWVLAAATTLAVSLPCPGWASAADTATPDQATLIVRADDKSRVYGSSNPRFTVSLTGLVNGDTAVLTGAPVITTIATPQSGAGTYTIKISQGTLSAKHYKLVLVDGTLTVGPAMLTAAAENQTRTVGAANPALTLKYSGFVNGDTPAILTGAPNVYVAATSSSPVGTYAISPTQGTLKAPNYFLAFSNGMLTVTPQRLDARVIGSPVGMLAVAHASQEIARILSTTIEPAPAKQDVVPKPTITAKPDIITAEPDVRPPTRAALAAVAQLASAKPQAAYPKTEMVYANPAPARSRTETAYAPSPTAGVRPTLALENLATSYGQEYATVAANVSVPGRWTDDVNEGIVTFTVQSAAGEPLRKVISAPVSDGQAQAELPLRGLPSGTYRIAANYDPLTTDSGDYASSAAAAPATLTVQRRKSITIVRGSPTPASPGVTMTLTATVASENGVPPTGSVRFFVDNLEVGTAPLRLIIAQAVASVTTVVTDAGSHEISAEYTGDAGSSASASQSMVLVRKNR